MNTVELGQIMIEYGVTLRAIPAEVYGVYEKGHAAEFPDGQIVYLEEFKREMLITKHVPPNAGKFLFEYKCSTGNLVKFGGKEYFNSIEDAAEAILRLKKPGYPNL